jgi:hypothetical protein
MLSLFVKFLKKIEFKQVIWILTRFLMNNKTETTIPVKLNVIIAVLQPKM